MLAGDVAVVVVLAVGAVGAVGGAAAAVVDGLQLSSLAGGAEQGDGAGQEVGGEAEGGGEDSTTSCMSASKAIVSSSFSFEAADAFLETLAMAS